ncbi:hypothetical protein TNCV_4468581 [Trichonephila clavipes]|nr:hypothetical protein TNCV_4468581 [Trichonephila clavipes]
MVSSRTASNVGAPMRHGVNEANVIMSHCPTLPEELLWGWLAASNLVFLERRKRALSDSSSGEHAGHSIRATIPSSKRKSSTSSHALLPTPCCRDDALMLALTHTVSQRAYQTYTMDLVSDSLEFETVVPVAERRCCWRRVVFIFRCFRAVNTK